MRPVTALCVRVCCIVCVCDCVMVIREPTWKLCNIRTRTRQWLDVLKPKSYSLVEGNQTLVGNCRSLHWKIQGTCYNICARIKVAQIHSLQSSTSAISRWKIGHQIVTVLSQHDCDYMSMTLYLSGTPLHLHNISSSKLRFLVSKEILGCVIWPLGILP